MRHTCAGLAIIGAAFLTACGGGEKRSVPAGATVMNAPATTAARPAATSTIVLVPTTAVPTTPVPVLPSPTLPAAPPPTTEIPPLPPPPPPPPPPPTEPASGTTLTLVAIEVRFDTKSLSAPAGPITIGFHHADPSVAHNIHFFSKASSIGMTEPTTGPVTDTLSLGTLAPGSYSYKCDVHPQTMTGVLTVS